MQFSVAKTRVFQNIGRGTSFITDTATTTTAINSWFNERQRRLCNMRNFWFMRALKRYYIVATNQWTTYDFPIQDTNIAQSKYKSDMYMVIQETSEKVVSTFESGETWSAGSADTTRYKEGNQGWKLSPTASATVNSDRTYDVDLTKFSDGSSAGDSDIIRFWVWLDDDINCASISIIFDVNGGSFATDYYTGTQSTGFITGWNEINILKSSFTRTGSTTGKNWSTVEAIRIQAVASAKGTLNATFDQIRLVKAAPVETNQRIIFRDSELNTHINYNTHSNGKPEVYNIEGDKFRLYPYADRAYMAWLVYYGYLVDLSNDTDVNSLLNDYPDVLIAGATADGFRYLGMIQDAQSWETEYSKHVSDLLALDTVKKLSAEFQIVPKKDSSMGYIDNYIHLPYPSYYV